MAPLCRRLEAQAQVELKSSTNFHNTDLVMINRQIREELIGTLSGQLWPPKNLQTLNAREVSDIYWQCRQELIDELSPQQQSPRALEPPNVPEELKHLYRRCREELIAKLSVAAHVPEDVRYLYRKCRQEFIDTLSASAHSAVACGVAEASPPAQPGNDNAAEHFALFLAEPRALQAAELFRRLLCAADAGSARPLPTEHPSPHERIRRLKLPWRAQALWKLVDAKLAAVAPWPHPALRVVVVGAGPVGLRLAIELRAAGHEATVLEKRASFSRINRLHLWDWCKADLVALGAKIFDPPGPSFGANGDYCHIGIGELQSMLFKLSLLLGVQFRFGGQYSGIVANADGGWQVRAGGGDEEEALLPFDVLVGADGANSAVARTPEVAEEFGRVEIGLRHNSAIGLVANFVGNPRPGLRQFAWARQFAEARFASLEASTGIALENCVYYRSGDQHYMVMTPTQESLALQGAFVDPTAEDLTAAPNIRREQVRGIAAAAAAHFGLPAMDFVKPPHDAQLFDFSGTKRAQRGCAFLDGSTVGGHAAMVVLVGDALLEPFWPEGLGIVRGFHSALDAAAVAGAWASGGPAAARRASAEAFTALKTLNGKTAERVLQPDPSRYTADPKTRYRC